MDSLGDMTKIFNKTSQRNKRKILRRNISEPEIILWSCLKARNTKGRKFRRQYSIGRYVVDFYCPLLRLAIEIDGSSHARKDAKEYDAERQRTIEALGIKIIRFTNYDVKNNLKSVLSNIALFTTRH